MTVRLLGGALMLLLGVLYIAFQKSILNQSAQSKDGLASARADGLSRSLLGIQVCPSVHSRKHDLT